MNQLSIRDDKFIHGLHALIQTIHGNGAKAAIQLQHAGRKAESEMILMQPVAPSALPFLGGGIPMELTIDEFAKIFVSFSEEAL